MKARVKATGDIVEVKSKVTTSLVTGESLLKYVDQKTGVSYFEEELFFPKDSADDPDYWTRLEHQYAGMAMQGILGNQTYTKNLLETSTSAKDARDIIVDASYYLAHALVEKYKKEK